MVQSSQVVKLKRVTHFLNVDSSASGIDSFGEELLASKVSRFVQVDSGRQEPSREPICHLVFY